MDSYRCFWQLFEDKKKFSEKVPFQDWSGVVEAFKGKRADEPLLELSMLQHREVDKAPRPSISNVIWILSAQPIILWAVNAAALRSLRLSGRRKVIPAQDIFHGNVITIFVFTNIDREEERVVQKYPRRSKNIPKRVPKRPKLLKTRNQQKNTCKKSRAWDWMISFSAFPDIHLRDSVLEFVYMFYSFYCFFFLKKINSKNTFILEILNPINFG